MIKNYFTVAIRNLIRHKGYFLINLLGLTIGLTSCLLITYYIIDELSYDKFHEHGKNIYRVGYNVKIPTGESLEYAVSEYKLKEAFQTYYQEIENFVRISRTGEYFIEYENKRFYETRVSMVDKDFFDIFTFEWIAGDKKTALIEPYTAVITESIAKKYFGQENPINKTMTIKAYEEAEIRITGVIKDMPSKSHFHLDFMFSMESAPFLFPKSAIENWGSKSVYSYIKLPEKVNIESIKATSKELLDKNWGFDVDGEMTFLPLFDIHLHSSTETEFEDNGSYRNILIFSLIAIFILVIASINYMNLTTAKSTKRSMEVGIRKVLGASRKKIMLQFLSESIIVTFIAFLVSIALSDLIIPKFNQIANKEITIEWMNNLWVIGAVIIASLLIGIISGSYPAFFLSSFKPLKVLKERISISSSNSILRNVLVISQFTISVILIACTLIIFNQWNFMRNKPLGVDPSNVVFFRHPGPKHYDTFKAELLKNPNIFSISTSSHRPTYTLNTNLSYEAEGVITEENSSVKIVAVGYDFFETLGNKIIQGRSFNKDFREDENSTFIINESALRLFGWDGPINKFFNTSTFSFEIFNWVPRKGKVIGVAEDFHFESLHNEIAPVVYFIDHNWASWVSVKINAKNKPSAINYITEQWNNLNIDNIRFNPEFYEDNLENLYRPEKQFFVLFIIFSILAISIACLGIFGLASYIAEQRTKEIGIRKAMGASVANIVRLINKEFLKLVLFSNLIAWPLSWYFMKNWLNNFVYRIDLTIWPFLISGAITIIIALLSVSYQALRASHTNPVVALRYE